MNANVVGGVGGEDEGSLPQGMMPQALTETVYLGRASFRITHEIETVSVEEPSVDSSTWFARDSVILQGGPNMMDRLTETGAEPGWDQVDPGPRRWFKRSWLMVAVPVAAFALGLLVAQLAGSSARSASRHVALAARTTVPPAIPPSSIAAPVEKAEAPSVAAPAVAVIAPGPVAAAPVPSTAVATPPAPVAVAVAVAAAEPRRTSSPEREPMAPRQGRPAKRHDLRSVKTDRPAASPSTSATEDDAPAAEQAHKPAATKASAAEWVDPWAN